MMQKNEVYNKPGYTHTGIIHVKKRSKHLQENAVTF